MTHSGFQYSSFGAEEGEATKLVVLAHGGGVNRTYMHKMAELLAEQIPQARIECPNAPDKAGTFIQRGLSRLKHHFSKSSGLSGEMYQWISKDKGFDGAYSDFKKIVPHYNDFIDRRRDVLGLQDKDVALMGFSQGALITLGAAWQRANPPACLVLHSAYVPDVIAADSDFTSKKQNILFLYGDKDEVFSREVFDKGIAATEPQSSKFDVHIVENLTHKTSSQSRAIAADYIAMHLK